MLTLIFALIAILILAMALLGRLDYIHAIIVILVLLVVYYFLTSGAL